MINWLKQGNLEINTNLTLTLKTYYKAKLYDDV